MSDFDFTEAIEAGAAGKRSMQRVDRALTELGVPQDMPTLDQRLYWEQPTETQGAEGSDGAVGAGEVGASGESGEAGEG